MKSSLRFPLLLALGCAACDPKTGPSGQASTTPITSEAQTSRPASSTTSSSPTTSASPNKVDAPAADALAKLAESSNAFGFDLYARHVKDGGNFIVSPASLSTALAMTWAGAKGETAAQMKKVLHFGASAEETLDTSGKLAALLQEPSRPITFRIANQLFGEKTYSFEQSYLDRTKAAFGAPLERVDFVKAFEPARLKINGWVEDKTEKKIVNLIPEQALDADTRLVLVNAIYFLGDWATPFEKEQTRPMSFSTTKNAKKDVPTMNRMASFKTAKKDGATMVELPYKGGAMSMLVVLPDNVDGLAALESSLDAKKLADFAGALATENVLLSMPKFEVKPQKSLELGEDLKALGMPLAFDRQKADFTGIANPPSPTERLVIAKVFHKGFVRVDEKGTEAAAASAVSMARAGSAAPPKPTEIRVDHPFMFFIRDNASGLVVFMGRVSDPSTT